MVSISHVRAANFSIKSKTSSPVAVVAGGTNGIGYGFLKELAASTDSPRIYFLGRSQQAMDDIKMELITINPSGEYIPIIAKDLTLLSCADEATSQIIKKEKSKVDILFMSQGYLAFGGRDESVEGLDKITSIRFYARMRILMNLLPLLNKAPSPRVISVLAGGMEGVIFPEDLSFKDPKNYSFVNIANGSATYTTLFLEKLQQQNPKISFSHMYPGLVKTNLANAEHFGTVISFLVNWIVVPTIGRFFMMSLEDCGARALYLATNGKFSAASDDTAAAVGSNGEIGTGVYTISGSTEPVHNDKVLRPLRENGVDQKIYEHTLEEFERVRGH